MVKIEKGMPIPDFHRGRWQSRYPFREMEVGDRIKLKNKSNSLAVYWSHQTGWTFRQWTDPDTGEIYIIRVE